MLEKLVSAIKGKPCPHLSAEFYTWERGEGCVYPRGKCVKCSEFININGYEFSERYVGARPLYVKIK